MSPDLLPVAGPRAGARMSMRWRTLALGAALLGSLSGCGATQSDASPEDSAPGTHEQALQSALQYTPAELASTTTPSTDEVGMPVVAAGNGLYLVVWVELRASGMPDLLGVRVRASDGVRLDATPLSIATRVNSVEWKPSVAFDGTNFLVVWEDITGTPLIMGTRVRASDGALLDATPVLLSPPPTYLPQQSPSVTFDGTNYVVGWYGYAATPTGPIVSQVRGIHIRPSDLSRVEPDAFNLAPVSARPHVASNGATTLVSWVSNGVKSVRVDGAGQVLDSTPLQLGTAAASRVRTAAQGGEFLVVWDVSGSLWARRVRASDGALLGGADILVGSQALIATEAPFDVTFDGTDYRVLWQGMRNGSRKLLTTRVSTAGTVGSDAEQIASDIPDASPSDWVGTAATGPARFLVTHVKKNTSEQKSRTWFQLGSPNSCSPDVNPPVLFCPESITWECVYSGQRTQSGRFEFRDNCGLSAVYDNPQYIGSPGSSLHGMSAVDLSGNGTSCTTVWNVVDTKKPTVYLFGAANVTLTVGQTYQEQNAWAEDGCDGAVFSPGWVQIFGSVNTQVPGTYTLGYIYTDRSGNTSDPVIRRVTVLPAQ